MQTSTALCVVHTAKGGHTAHTAPVHIHLATWWDKTGDSISGPGLHQPHLISPLNLRHCTVVEGERPLAPDLGWGSRYPAGHTHRNISCPGAPAHRGGTHSGRRRWDCCSCADGTCACCEGPRKQRGLHRSRNAVKAWIPLSLTVLSVRFPFSLLGRLKVNKETAFCLFSSPKMQKPFCLLTLRPRCLQRASGMKCEFLQERSHQALL